MDLVTVIRRVQRKKVERERARTRAFCSACGGETTLVSVAATEEISQWFAAGALHLIHKISGEILICEYYLRQNASERDDTQPMRTEFLRSMKAAA